MDPIPGKVQRGKECVRLRCGCWMVDVDADAKNRSVGKSMETPLQPLPPSDREWEGGGGGTSIYRCTKNTSLGLVLPSTHATSSS